MRDRFFHLFVMVATLVAASALPSPSWAAAPVDTDRTDEYQTDAMIISYVRRGQWETTMESLQREHRSRTDWPRDKIQRSILDRFLEMGYAWFKPQGGHIDSDDFARRDILAIFLTCRGDQTIELRYRRYNEPAEFDNRRTAVRDYGADTFMCNAS